MDPQTILNIVEEVQAASDVKDKTTFFTEKYPEFVKNYPGLFEMVCQRKIEMGNLSFMIDMLTKMKNDNMTQFDASSHVGQMLFSKYVEPNINMNKEKK